MSEETGTVVRVDESGMAEVVLSVPPPADHNCCGVPAPGAAVVLSAKNLVGACVGDAVRVETRYWEGLKVALFFVIGPIVFAGIGYVLFHPWGFLFGVLGLLFALAYRRWMTRSMLPRITQIVSRIESQ